MNAPRFLVPLTATDFGECLDLSEMMPEGSELVLLCQVTNEGYQPKKLLLAHQIYAADLLNGEWVAFPLTKRRICLTSGAQ